jgi:signal transduction histidine kinase
MPLHPSPLRGLDFDLMAKFTLLRGRTGVFLLAVLLAIAGSLLLFFLVMKPPAAEMLQLGLIFALTGVFSLFIGFISHRAGWWRRLGSLSRSLTLIHLLAVGFALMGIWFAARLMFINDHDLTLGGLLLLFAGGISIAFGYFLSNSLVDSLRELAAGTERLREGDFSVRLRRSGNDEVAQLTTAFNAMAERLDMAEQEAKQLEQARKEFIAGASHDLRTPLASLQAMLSAIYDGVVTDQETIRAYLERSEREIAHMGAIIDDLVELARLDAGYPELETRPDSLTELISSAIEGFSAAAADRQIAVVHDLERGIDPVVMAADKIGRVLQNLVDNALQHTPKGGEVHIRARRENGWVLIEVQDSGQGIPSVDLPHVFDRFYRGEKSRRRNGSERGGVGLGLAIAKGFVEAHGGEIWVKSAPDQGANFCFRLPRSEG